MARKIFDFNHISPELNREQIDELIRYYKTTHHYNYIIIIISLGASLLIEILLDYKNVNENMNNCKYAYQSYGHLMIQIKTAMRLGQFNSQILVNAISNLDNFLLIFAH